MQEIHTQICLLVACNITYTFYTGKFGAVFASIPAPIIAALYCLFFAYVGRYYKLMEQVLNHHYNSIQG